MRSRISLLRRFRASICCSWTIMRPSRFRLPGAAPSTANFAMWSTFSDANPVTRPRSRSSPNWRPSTASGPPATCFFAMTTSSGARSGLRSCCKKSLPGRRAGVPPTSFLTQASINLGQDPEMIELMIAANLWEVFIGIESPDENVLRNQPQISQYQEPPA